MALNEMVTLIQTLRGESGCPWDRKQTPASLKKYILSEVEEVVAAIDNQDVANTREEVGDLFFLLAMVVAVHEEQGDFNLADVLSEVNQKMIRRHPHVFSDSTARTDAEIKAQWEAIKAVEKAERQQNAPL